MFVFSGDKRGPEKGQPQYEESYKGVGPVKVTHEGICPLKMTMAIKGAKTHLDESKDYHQPKECDDKPTFNPGDDIVEPFEGIHWVQCF